MTLENFISYFENTRKTSSGYTAKCSAHEDKINSLSISESDGKILLYCHAGCKPEEIVKSKNLEMKDLFTESKNYDTQNTQEYIYTDENNKILFKSVRWYNGDKKSFCLKRYNVGTWINGLNNIKLVVYKLPKVLEAVKENTPIFIVEGEKDVENLLKLGFTATTNPMGAGKWRKYFNHHFENAQVYIIPDNDKPGKQHAKNICENLKGIAKKLRVIDLENLEEHEDITDYLHKNCKTKKEAINEIKNLMSIAKPYASSAFRDIRDENSENQEIKWDKLIPLDEIQILEFPMEAFPPVISEYLEALSINTQTSPEMAGILILGVLAVCN